MNNYNSLFANQNNRPLLKDIGENVVHWKDNDFISFILEKIFIRDLIIAPGHEFLSDIREFNETFRESSSANPIIVNIIVRDNTMRSVEIWDGHHRLKRMIDQSQTQTLSHLFPEQLVILLNGRVLFHPNCKAEENKTWEHWIPHWGTFLGHPTLILYESLKEYPIDFPGVRPFTVAVKAIDANGPLSNSELGCTTTLANLNNPTAQVMKSSKTNNEFISDSLYVYFGTFNPIHKGHLAVAHHILNTLPQSQILFIPNALPNRDPLSVLSLEHRENMIELCCRQINESLDHYGRVKVLKGTTAEHGDESNRTALLYGLSQIYCLPIEKIRFLVGADSLPSPCLRAQRDLRFIIVPREQRPISALPGDEVLSDFFDSFHLSATQIRVWMRSYSYHVSKAADSPCSAWMKEDLERLLTIAVTRPVFEYLTEKNLFD